MNRLANDTGRHDGDGPPEGLYEYWYALRSGWGLIATITIAVVALVLVVTLLITAQYTGTATLQIERDAMRVVNVEDVIPTESPLDRDFYQTQYELLRSRTLAREVIRNAKLAGEPAYRDIVDKVNGAIDDSDVAAKKTPQARQQAIERALTQELLANLEIEPVRNSRLLRINFDSPDPALSARVANSYARTFIASNQARRVDATAFAVKYLSDRLAALRGSVEDSEKQLVDFAGKEQIVSFGEAQPSLTAQNLTELNGLLAAAQQNRIKAEAAWQRAKAGNGLGLPQVVANPLIQTLRIDQAKLSSEYRQKLPTFKPDYPEMRRLRSQISESNRQVASEVANVRTSIRTEYETSQLQERLIVERIERLKLDELDLRNRSIQYNMLQRDVDKNRQLYEALLQRYKEVGVASELGASNISIIDTADVPGRPSSPRLPLNVALALLFGLGLGVMATLLRHFLRSGHRERMAHA